MTSCTKKIGVLSTQFTINYGAVLQSFSLFNTLQKIENCDVTVINYAPQSARYGHYEMYNFRGFKNTVLSTLKIVNLKYRLSRSKKKKAFDDFVCQEFVFTNETYYTNQELIAAQFDFDLVIVGSDQVWNPKVIDDPSFYLNFIDTNRTLKSSYAASLGDELSQRDLLKLVEYISDFSKISFREPIQLFEIQNKVGKDISVLVDPVFLTPKSEWLMLAQKSKLVFDEPYILIYEVNSPPEFKKYVDFLLKNTQLKLIELSTRPFSKYPGVTTISNAGPYDFLKLFSDANYVLTSSFHGVAFSSILNKAFSCVLNIERSTRQRHLLQQLNIKSLEVNKLNELSVNYKEKINWDIVNKNIKLLQKKSHNYINELIKNVT